jgi:hypothetical protein
VAVRCQAGIDGFDMTASSTFVVWARYVCGAAKRRRRFYGLSNACDDARERWLRWAEARAPGTLSFF